MTDTKHSIIFGNSNDMKEVEDESIDLIVTSPPYSMYDMWDSMFTNMNAEIGDCLKTNPMRAFKLQHRELDKVWDECIRVLKDGGFMCINIADAPRSFNGDFQMFDNHSHIATYLTNKGLKELPPIVRLDVIKDIQAVGSDKDTLQYKVNYEPIKN